MFNAWICTSSKDSPGGRVMCVCVLSFCRGWACGLWWFLWANGTKDAGWDSSHGRTEGAPLRLQTGKRSPARHCEVRLQVSVKGPDTMTVLWSVQRDFSLERAKSAWLTLVNKSEGRRGDGAECRRKMFKGGGKYLYWWCFYVPATLPSVSPVNSCSLHWRFCLRFFCASLVRRKYLLGCSHRCQYRGRHPNAELIVL